MDLSDTSLSEEIEIGPEDSDVSVGRYVKAIPRALAESILGAAFDDLFEVVPAVGLWLMTMVGWVLLHLFMLAAHLLSSDYVLSAISCVLAVVSLAFIFVAVTEDDRPINLVIGASEPQGNVPPPKNRV